MFFFLIPRGGKIYRTPQKKLVVNTMVSCNCRIFPEINSLVSGCLVSIFFLAHFLWFRQLGTWSTHLWDSNIHPIHAKNIGLFLWKSTKVELSLEKNMAMDQYLYIPFLGGWTSIYQLFDFHQGHRVLTHSHMACCIFPRWFERSKGWILWKMGIAARK